MINLKLYLCNKDKEKLGLIIPKGKLNILEQNYKKYLSSY
jgi:hypothetical protein